MPTSTSRPATGSTFSRNRDVITVGIESAPSELAGAVSWAGPCVTSDSIRVPPGDTSVRIGRRTIQQASSQPTTSAKPTETPTTCRVTLTLSRQIDGTVDPAYDEGSIVARTTSTREISSTP